MAKRTELMDKCLLLPAQARTSEEYARLLEASPIDVEKLFRENGFPDGFEVVLWKNHLGIDYFELVPPEKPREEPKPRAFRFIRSKNDSYIRVFIPDDILDASGKKAKFIEIFPFSDVHWGHKQCDKRNFLLDVKEVERRPNRFAWLNGDIIENALGDSAGGAAWAEQDMTPDHQRETIQEVFHRISHRLLLGLPGNHEDRSKKKSQSHPLKEVCSGLDVPYFSGPVNLEVIWKGYRWTFHLSHGTGASNKVGGKLNMAGRPRGFTDFRNFFVVGHVHDQISHKVIRTVPRREFEGNVLKRFWKEEVKEYKVICPSYLLYAGTYAEEMGYDPGSRNTIAMQLYANGEYYVVSSVRQKNGGRHDQTM